MLDHAPKNYLKDRPYSRLAELAYIVAIGLTYFFLLIDWSI